MSKTAKLFENGRSQAVRLPKEFRFEGTEVNVRRDPETGDVILSQPINARGQLDGFFKLLEKIKEGDIPDDFLCEVDRSLGKDGNLRDPFEGWKE